ncbi:hypothetical protein PMSD_19770 [Paenibacillus macquariensis subsp. defensor]|nr:hypothetical protein PMSD_19770 [Paenibacillus macquariensis subsp. defensor]
MGERNILAYFKSPEEADQVSRKLASLRVVDMSINRFGSYMGGDLNPSEGILTAASAVSGGMSDRGQDGTRGFDILLTVVTENDSFDQAMRIIEEAGGMV